MFIDKLVIQKLGPFYDPTEVRFDRNVTILTGANDTGKSSVLRILTLFLRGEFANEMDINQDHIQESKNKWHEDSALIVKVKFMIESGRDVHENTYNWSPGDHSDYVRCVAKDRGTKTCVVQSKAHGSIGWGVALPSVVFAPSGNEIGERINLSSPKPLERILLDTAFGGGFSWQAFQALGHVNQSRAIRQAENVLNREMERVMPDISSLRFVLQILAGHPNEMSLLLRDRHDGITPFGLRGTGVRKMITLLAELITISKGLNRLIVMDEPENSLHADSQHLLREFLYELSKIPGTQVIYSTHSPCMINPMRPEQVRLLRRNLRDGKPHSLIENRPCDSNFLGLRTSLGMSPSDSLLYAPVTVIIEGDTEFASLALVMKKLQGLTGFEDVNKLIALTHFLDGMGDNFELLVRFAKSQGPKVVLFLDGDKRHRIQQHKIAELHPDVEIILLDGNDEFEDLVKKDVYFSALAAELQEPDSPSLLKSWESWVEKDSKANRKPFSKKVGDWLESTREQVIPTKPAIMRRAVEIATTDQITAEPFRKLLSAIRKQLAGTSF